jgi:hypothetical protein
MSQLPRSELLGKYTRPSYEMRYYGMVADRAKATYRDISELEIQFTPAGFPTIPSRPFVMACRPLCGFEWLRYPHPTCWAFCRLRRVYYGKMPAHLAIHIVRLQLGHLPYSLLIQTHRCLARIKDVLIGLCFTIARSAYGSSMYYTGYRGRNLVVWACLTTSEALAN